MPSPNPQESPASSSPTERFGTTGLILIALLLVGGVIAYLVLRDDGADAGAGSETLVVLDGNEMHHIGADGEITASFDLGFDAQDLSGNQVVGSHIVTMLGNVVIAINAADGEVQRFNVPEGRGLAPATIAGQTSLVALGSPSGTNVLDVIDLRDGSRHRLAAGSGDAMYTIDMVRASPDGSMIGVTDVRAESDTPSVVMSIDDGERIELPGFLAGLSNDRAITSEHQPDQGVLLIRWFDQDGEETASATIEPPDAATAMPDGSVVFITDGAMHRLAEGDDTPQDLEGPELDPDQRPMVLPVGTDGRIILTAGDEVFLLDREGQVLASDPAPYPWWFDRSRTNSRCLALGYVGQPGLVLNLEAGEAVTDGNAAVFAQSPGDGCTLVTGEQSDDVIEYTVTGSDTVHVDDPGMRPSGVSSEGLVVAMNSDGVFFLPSEEHGEPLRIYENPAWNRFIAVGT